MYSKNWMKFWSWEVKKMSKVVHFKPEGEVWFVCGVGSVQHSISVPPYTEDVDKVTCKNCMKTRAYKNAKTGDIKMSKKTDKPKVEIKKLLNASFGSNKHLLSVKQDDSGNYDVCFYRDNNEYFELYEIAKEDLEGLITLFAVLDEHWER